MSNVTFYTNIPLRSNPFQALLEQQRRYPPRRLRRARAVPPEQVAELRERLALLVDGQLRQRVDRRAELAARPRRDARQRRELHAVTGQLKGNYA